PYDGEDYGVKLMRYFASGDDTGFDYTDAGEDSAPGSKNNPVYDKDLGHPIITKYYLVADAISADPLKNVSQKYYFEWKRKTSSGVSLQNNTDYTHIMLEWKVEAIKDKKVVASGSLGSHNADGNLYKFWNLYSEIYPALGDKVPEHDILRYYVRVVATENNGIPTVLPSDNAKWICGEWTYYDSGITDTGSYDGNGYIDEDGTTVREDNEVTTGSVYDSDIDSALDKIENNYNYADYITNLSALADQVKAIPGIIASVFSFLPPWCLALVALSVGTLAVLMVIKFVRG
ncbi:MAG: hypothetical protein NC131_21160, partial [Roseburia sp.]|nr:hypothetical protein [Roseburia sp.]